MPTVEAKGQEFEFPDGVTNEQISEALDEYFSAKENPSVLDKVAGGLETAATFATGAIAEPIAGAAGMVGALNPFQGEGSGAQTVEQVREMLTYDPRTEQGRKYLESIGGSDLVQGIADLMGKAEKYSGDVGYATGEALGIKGAPEVLGSVYSAIPTAIGEVAGGLAPTVAAKTLSRRAKGLQTQAQDVDSDLASMKSDVPTEQGMQLLADEISSKSPDLGSISDFDPEILKAAHELGFEEVPPSVAANNAQLREITQGLASMAGSKSGEQYGQFVEALAKKADDLIVEGGGEIDKAVLSSRYADETERMINSLDNVESDIYSNIREVVTPSKQVDLPDIRTHILGVAAEYGGFDRMPEPYKDLMEVVFEPAGGGKYRSRRPTYAEFDLKRKEIGQSLNKKAGPYADSESGMLSYLYGAMKNQQRNLMEDLGAKDLQDAADAVTIKKKAIQNTKTDLLGRNLSKDLMPQVASRITGLPKGNVKKFSELMQNIPKDMRSPVAVSALNDILRGTGADQKGMGAARFVGMMEEFDRSPTAKKELYKYLPRETRKSLDNMYKLAKGVYKANQKTIKTGAIQQFFPDNRSFANRLMDVGVGVVSAKAGPFAGMATDSLRSFIENSTPAARQANDLIASKEFQDVMRSAVRDGVVDGNAISAATKKKETLLENSDAYKKWADGLTGANAAMLSSVGVMSYLLSPEVEEGKR